MRTYPRSPHASSGSTLTIVVVTGGIMSIIVAGTVALSNFTLRSAHGRLDFDAAFFHAENALQWAAQDIADSESMPNYSYFSTAAGSLDLPYMISDRSDGNSGFKNAWVKVANSSANLPNDYIVTASARVNNKVRTIQARVTKSPSSRIFDYEYFLNNWGWWWGSSITGYGGNRANWDFDFRDHPTVNGQILANGNVTQDGVPVDPFTQSPPFGGMAGNDPISLVHSGVPREAMPNLKDFSYYSDKAMAGAATNGIWVGSTRVVSGIQGNLAKPGLYLSGTDSDPIRINGTVVVPGDVVIKGKITGKGTLYVGGNLYVAGNLSYVNGPNWSGTPETMSPAQRDQWVSDNKNKDLIGFAVRESILAGDVTSSEWKSYCYDAASYGLKNVGSEANLGADGIAHTGDDGIPFDHHDGTQPSAWYDADGDGVVDGNFNYTSDITMTSSRANAIQGYPTDQYGSALSYNKVASNSMNLLDGIFYTNHAAAMRLAANNALFHGVIVSRDEAIVFNSTCRFVYDSRVHSRYNKDPNRFVDLGLPVAGVLRISEFSELPPDSTNL